MSLNIPSILALKPYRRRSARRSLGSNLHRAIYGISAAACLLGAPIAHANDCPIEVGQKVEYELPETTYNHFKSLDLERDEFETVVEYRHRLVKEMDGMRETHIVRGEYNVDAAQYDADREVMRLFVYSWANAGTGWEEVFPFKSIFGVIEYNRWSDQPFLGIGLGSEQSVVGEYEGSNAYGASATVQQVARQVYSVFDEGVNDPDLWHFDGKGDYDSENSVLRNTGYVDIPMPVDQARAFKEKLKVVVAFTPQAPFFATGSRNWSPTISRPRETTADYRVLLGNLLCVGVLGPDDNALKVIMPIE